MIGKKYFLNAINGLFSEIPEAGSHQHTFTEIEGRLLHVRFHETSSGETMRLYIVDDTSVYIVSMFVNSRLFTAFGFACRNLNLRTEIKFRIKRERGLDHLTFHQFGNSVRWYFDESNKDQLPNNREDRTAFFKQVVQDEIISSLEKILNPFPFHPIYKPLGSGKGLQGGYFKDSNVRVGRNAVSNGEANAAGYTSKAKYISDGRNSGK